MDFVNSKVFILVFLFKWESFFRLIFFILNVMSLQCRTPKILNMSSKSTRRKKFITIKKQTMTLDVVNIVKFIFH
jgi:hypothetical protein